MLQRKNQVHPFEDAATIEFLCEKNHSSLFATASHSKKRPNNLVLGRTFDGRVLDMMEFEVDGFASLSEFKVCAYLEWIRRQDVRAAVCN